MSYAFWDSPKDDGCPPNQELFNDQCVDKCPDGEKRNTTTGICEKGGGDGCPPGQELFNDQCVDKCPDGEKRNTTTGICEKGGGDGCPPGQELFNDQCVDKCPDGEKRNTTTGICEKGGGDGCPPGQELFNDQCVDKCPDGEKRNTTTGICEKGGGDGCPPGQELFNDQCVDKCPDGEKRNTTTGVCEKGGGGGLTCPTHAYDDDGVCVCTGGYAPTYSADNTLIACTLIDPGCPTNGELNEFGECVCKEGFTPGYTEGVLTSCTATKTNGNGDDDDDDDEEDCPANSTRNDEGVCVCNTGYSPSTDSAGVMTCVLNFPAQDCSNPAWAATHVAECGSCEDKEYAEANPQICGIKKDDPYTRPYATFEGVDMVRPPWVTPPDVRIDRYPASEPSTYSTLPAPAGSYEYGISSLARRPQDIREAVSVIDPGYEQIQAGGPPVFTMEEVSPEEEASRRAATDRYYGGAMNRLSDYSTLF